MTPHPLGTVRRVSPETLRLHRLFVIKHTVPLANQRELLQGPLDAAPAKAVRPPAGAFDTRADTAGLLEYPLTQRDPVGERKVSVYGQLLYGAHFLFTTFSLARHGMTLFVLVPDLMRALHCGTADPNAFLQRHPQLLPLTATPEDTQFLRDMELLGPAEGEGAVGETPLQYVTARSAYVVFGAATVASAHRVADDYWETLAKQQGMSPHHRVYTVPHELLQLLHTLQPALGRPAGAAGAAEPPSPEEEKEGSAETPEFATQGPGDEPSSEARAEYLAAFARGEHVAQPMPGQGLSDPLELAAQFRVPKYHSKNSFLQATQARALDLPIGLDPALLAAQAAGTPAAAVIDGTVGSMASFASAVRNNTPGGVSGATPYSDAVDSDATTAAASPVAMPQGQGQPQPQAHTSRPMSRMLSNLLMDSGASAAATTTATTNGNGNAASPMDTPHPYAKNNPVLNINGWKFETLPLRENPVQMQTVVPREGEITDDAPLYTVRGLPVYRMAPLLHRLRRLTPNQIRELEYSHDALVLNTGVQRARALREHRWRRYWQYKAGVALSGENDALSEKVLQRALLRAVTQYRDVREVYNAETNCDEVHTTKRVANANMWGCANVAALPPPYAPVPPEVVAKQLREQRARERRGSR